MRRSASCEPRRLTVLSQYGAGCSRGRKAHSNSEPTRVRSRSFPHLPDEGLAGPIASTFQVLVTKDPVVVATGSFGGACFQASASQPTLLLTPPQKRKRPLKSSRTGSDGSQVFACPSGAHDCPQLIDETTTLQLIVGVALSPKRRSDILHAPAVA